MPSRRQILAGVGVAEVAAVGLGSQVSTGDLTTTDPPGDSWPQTRRDAANTASTDVAVPSNPAVSWSTRAIQDAELSTLVADGESVYVGGYGLAALDRASGEPRWRRDGRGDILALHGDTLYATEARGTDVDFEEKTLRAYDATDGAERWEAVLPAVAHAILPTDDAVFVGCHGGLVRYGLDGAERWRTRIERAGAVRPTVHDGTLYVTGPGQLSRYGAQTALESALEGTPSVDWRVPGVAGGPATVVDGRAVAGEELTWGDSTDASVCAFDATSGTWAWSALDSRDAAAAEELTWLSSLTPARVGGGTDSTLGVTGVARYSSAPEAGSVVALDLRDGSVAWQYGLDSAWASAVTGVREGFLVGLFNPTGAGVAGGVRHYAPTGEARWTVEVDDDVHDVVPVDGTVFAVLGDGRVVALR